MAPQLRYAWILLLTLGGCATVDFDYPRSESWALMDTEDTYFGQRVRGHPEMHPGESGFHLLNDGIEALAARLLMAERAERSIDAQYYLLKNDLAGQLFVDALLRAADRGVRVRVLLDDMFTGGMDADMMVLDAHPQVEIRVFNPFARHASRLMNVTSARRINRRMHNKAFTVDNQMTIIGGRNIAEEYFGAKEEYNFGDLDTIAAGPVVSEVSGMFDEYWNHRLSLPLPAFMKAPEDLAGLGKKMRTRLEVARESIDQTRYYPVLEESIEHFTEIEVGHAFWAPYRFLYDSPDKGLVSRPRNMASIVFPLRDELIAAERELIIFSPYFVPRRRGVELFVGLVEQGVDVTVVTNSLAANNQKLVHAGYAPSRKALLRGGVKIFEMRPDVQTVAAYKGGNVDSSSTLHTKAFIVDRRDIFLGSFNFDPRSVNINTEMGIVVRAPEKVGDLLTRVELVLADYTYRLSLSERGSLRWTTFNDREVVVFTREPETGFWDRCKANLMRLLPIRGQL